MASGHGYVSLVVLCEMPLPPRLVPPNINVQTLTDKLNLLQKSSSIDKVSLPIDTTLKNQALQYRRCVVIALVGSTNPGDPSIERILASGYLTSLKSWLADILANPTGMWLSIATVPTPQTLTLATFSRCRLGRYSSTSSLQHCSFACF